MNVSKAFIVGTGVAESAVSSGHIFDVIEGRNQNVVSLGESGSDVG